jgi:hypothetical protein
VTNTGESRNSLKTAIVDAEIYQCADDRAVIWIGIHRTGGGKNRLPMTLEREAGDDFKNGQAMIGMGGPATRGVKVV